MNTSKQTQLIYNKVYNILKLHRITSHIYIMQYRYSKQTTAMTGNQKSYADLWQKDSCKNSIILVTSSTV